MSCYRIVQTYARDLWDSPVKCYWVQKKRTFMFFRYWASVNHFPLTEKAADELMQKEINFDSLKGLEKIISPK